MSKKTEQQARERTAKKRRGKKIILIILIVAIAVAAAIGIFMVVNGVFRPQQDTSPVAALRQYIFSEASVNRITADLQQNYAGDEIIIFLSLCNGQERATVVKGKGATLEAAWENAAGKAAEIIASKEYDVLWVKADIVNSTEEIISLDLNEKIVENHYQYFFRQGIAFDKNFDTAFLEAEINGNKMLTYYSESDVNNKRIEYTSQRLHLDNINYYLKAYYGYSELTKIPDKIIIFTTLGFFYDEDGSVYDLYSGGHENGRRVTWVADDKTVETAITNASRYLYDLIQPDGKFIYGYYPIFDNELTSYNILRHASSIWSLINLYRMTQDDELIPKLNAAINYLIEGFIEYQDADTAYVVERKADEIKLGGNGVSIIMLSEYMDIFATDEYTDLVRHLANGILKLEDENGAYYHVLNFPGFSRKEAYRTVYYDGEATFALTRAYTVTREQKYLDGAAKAVENFIAKDYTKYRDHWVSYALNEITKYRQEPRYFEFALRNIQRNLDTIYNQPTSYHTYLELLMVGWQTYERLLESGVKVDYLDEFDTQYFAETIYRRAFHMLNSYFYPEAAMYMKRPATILNAFFVRHDNFRVRIDDIQHFIGGYYYYTVYYNKIRPYLSEEFIAGFNKGAANYAAEYNEADIED